MASTLHLIVVLAHGVIHATWREFDLDAGVWAILARFRYTRMVGMAKFAAKVPTNVESLPGVIG